MATAATVRTLPGRYAKFITALAGNALVFADTTYAANNRWVEVFTAAAVALGVLAVPNTPAPPAALPELPPAYPGTTTAPGTISGAEAAEIKRQLAAAMRTPSTTAVPPAPDDPGPIPLA